ncbi:MAG: Rpn family recombination-promoting nuclease/putative transposase [Deltaproteobacteria bacterium]|nr:Rpn family recombination-promoting nuclease/putative transposase [Deltaproteobacteria bacterium]
MTHFSRPPSNAPRTPPGCSSGSSPSSIPTDCPAPTSPPRSIGPPSRLESGSFVDEELGTHHLDLFFSLRVAGVELELYSLLEHQSTNDDQMLLRAYNYMGQQWIRLRNRNPRGKLPLILCSLVSHARPSWTGPRTFAELFDPAVLALPGAADCVPNFGLMVEDLTCRSDADIAAMRLTDFPKLVLWALRDSHSKALILDGLVVWGRALCRILRTSDGRILLNYFATRLEDFSWSELPSQRRPR